MPRRRVKKEPQNRPTFCIVCGEAAAGYNYGCPSCARCKTFFRRAVIEKRMYSGCLKSGACERGGIVRLCRSCRYDRCIKGGMNPLLVSGVDVAEYGGAGSGTGGELADSNPDLTMTDSNEDELPSTSIPQSKPRRKRSKNVWSSAKIEETNDHLQASVECQTDCRASDEETPEIVPCDPGTSTQDVKAQEIQLVHNPYTFECKLEKMMQHLLTLEEAHQRLRISKYTPKMVPGLRIDDFEPGPSKLGVEFGPMQSQPYMLSSVKIVPVELIVRHRISVDVSNFDYELKKLWLYQDKIYSVEYIKALPIFKMLDKRSRMVLMASGIACANFTAAYYSYTHHSDRTCYPDGSVMTWSSEVHKESPGSTRLYTAIIAAMKEAELDSREYALLKSILICNPLLDGLHPTDSTQLQNEKERCTNTLLSYVLARRGVAKGPASFAKLLSIVDLTYNLTTWQKNQCMAMLALGLFKNSTPFAETMYHSH
ncbi:hypothetical protein PRIPAC_93837 [Pristionchus pacificus]|nr:hypothetical protein PRIPAC_93837 [Pristionchus pacificus]